MPESPTTPNSKTKSPLRLDSFEHKAVADSMRVCSGCSGSKPLEEYSLLKGLPRARCKGCDREYYRKNAARIKEHVRKRHAGIQAHPEKRARKNAMRRDWAKANRGVMTESVRSWRSRYPAALRAERQVEHAVRTGHLSASPCEVCSDTDAHAHHDDYSKPLDVRWLCRTHHMGWHKLNGPGKNRGEAEAPE